MSFCTPRPMPTVPVAQYSSFRMALNLKSSRSAPPYSSGISQPISPSAPALSQTSRSTYPWPPTPRRAERTPSRRRCERSAGSRRAPARKWCGACGRPFCRAGCDEVNALNSLTYSAPMGQSPVRCGRPGSLAGRTRREGHMTIERSSVVRVPKAGELVAADLRRQIITGELTPGEPLPTESVLMARFGVSQTDPARGVPDPGVGVDHQGPPGCPGRCPRHGTGWRRSCALHGLAAAVQRRAAGRRLPGAHGDRGLGRRSPRRRARQDDRQAGRARGAGRRPARRRLRLRQARHRRPPGHRRPGRQPDARRCWRR